METNNQDLNRNLLTLDGQPISAALVLEWLKADWVGRAMLQGYLAAGKAGFIAPKSRKNALKTGIQHTSNNDFA